MFEYVTYVNTVINLSNCGNTQEMVQFIKDNVRPPFPNEILTLPIDQQHAMGKALMYVISMEECVHTTPVKFLFGKLCQLEMPDLQLFQDMASQIIQYHIESNKTTPPSVRKPRGTLETDFNTKYPSLKLDDISHLLMLIALSDDAIDGKLIQRLDNDYAVDQLLLLVQCTKELSRATYYAIYHCIRKNNHYLERFIPIMVCGPLLLIDIERGSIVFNNVKPAEIDPPSTLDILKFYTPGTHLLPCLDQIYGNSTYIAMQIAVIITVSQKHILCDSDSQICDKIFPHQSDVVIEYIKWVKKYVDCSWMSEFIRIVDMPRLTAVYQQCRI